MNRKSELAARTFSGDMLLAGNFGHSESKKLTGRRGFCTGIS
jgi:hypothetical protein